MDRLAADAEEVLSNPQALVDQNPITNKQVLDAFSDCRKRDMPSQEMIQRGGIIKQLKVKNRQIRQ